MHELLSEFGELVLLVIVEGRGRGSGSTAGGFPVLRTETVPGSKEFNPRAYHVFGPKLIATRGFFDDAALESRFLTEEMSSLRLRADIPISLPASHETEALHLRNQLLLFRFRNHAKPRDLVANLDRSLEPRLAQIFAPLLAIVEDEETLADLRELAQSYNREMAAEPKKRAATSGSSATTSLIIRCGAESLSPWVSEVLWVALPVGVMKATRSMHAVRSLGSLSTIGNRLSAGPEEAR